MAEIATRKHESLHIWTGGSHLHPIHFAETFGLGCIRTRLYLKGMQILKGYLVTGLSSLFSNVQVSREKFN